MAADGESPRIEDGEARAAHRHYSGRDFANPLLECDVIMKGGVTSGLVYPYAILEIATRYRFRSLGGTSAGAIAAAFAAAAEYARSVRNDPDGFLRLQKRCDTLPVILPDLFQPDPEFSDLVGLATRIRTQGATRAIGALLARALLMVPVGAALGWLIRPDSGPAWPIMALVALLTGLTGLLAILFLKIWRPVKRAHARLLAEGFGFCSGLTVKGRTAQALTDWLHESLQEIAFGSASAPEILTFGHLSAPANGAKPITLRMVATNLSMGRPHTLPDLGLPAGLSIAEWARLFPEPVMARIGKTSEPWEGREGILKFPSAADLPVICAVRMSLSFPLLFKAVPLLSVDYELRSIVKGLGGAPLPARTEKIWMTDGGLSSNFPIHLFDAPLPSRPTFAFSLDTLQVPVDAVRSRVFLPETSAQGSMSQINEFHSLAGFGWRILAAAKDWQDQLASELTGQRERIVRIFLGPNEGGLNLDMKPDVSRALMGYGAEAGRRFVTGFNFDEHRWRRTLVTYGATTEWLDKMAASWGNGGADWYRTYAPRVVSYRDIPPRDRTLIGAQIEAWAAASAEQPRITNLDRLPAKGGVLRLVPDY